MLPHSKILPGLYPLNPIHIFQMNGRAGRFGLVKPGNLSKVVPLCLVFRAIEKNYPWSSQKVGRGILVSWGSYVTPP